MPLFSKNRQRTLWLRRGPCPADPLAGYGHAATAELVVLLLINLLIASSPWST